MSIRKKTIYFFITIFTSLIIITSLVLDVIISNEFGRLDSEKAITTNKHQSQMLNDNFIAMMPFIHDWAYWDCLYEYVQGLDDRFAQKNFNMTTLTSLEIDAMYIINLDGDIVHKELLKADGTPTTLDIPEYDDVQKKLMPLLDLDDDNHYIKGYIAGTDNVYFVSAHTILKSTGQGPYQGKLLILKKISLEDPKQNVFLSTVNNPLNIYDLTDPNIADDYTDILNRLDDEEYVNVPISSSEMRTYSVIKDMFNEPILLFETVYDRSINQQGEKLKYYSIASVTIVALVLAVLTYINFEKELVNELKKLTRFMEGVSRDSTTKERLNLRSNEELSVLSDIINGTLDKVIEQQKQLEKNNSILEETNKQLALKQQEIENNNKELSELNQAMVGREMKMVELKKEVEVLKERLGNVPLQ